MWISHKICGEYQLLELQLASALQLCIEYESPLVFPINLRDITPQHAEELRIAAWKEKLRMESRVFVHRSTCMVCLYSA
jgi:hypothetical protein